MCVFSVYLNTTYIVFKSFKRLNDKRDKRRKTEKNRENNRKTEMFLRGNNKTFIFGVLRQQKAEELFWNITQTILI